MSDTEDSITYDLENVEPVLGIGESLVAEDVLINLTEEDEITEKAPNKLDPTGNPIFNARSYQLEMLAESMKRNVIVAMVWFLAPTVPLCEQQYDVLQKHIPAVQIKFLSSKDKVDKWSYKGLWDAVLENVRIVVSPPQVLLDALNNGFVDINSIALMVFDEAHNCVKKNAGAQIMQDHYEQAIRHGNSIPHILGLSASPIMNSRPSSLAKIEDTLHAVCISPSLHRADLMSQNNIPELVQVLYTEQIDLDFEVTGNAPIFESLLQVCREMNILEDPYIMRLQSTSDEQSIEKLDYAIQRRKTWCFEQMNILQRTSRVIWKDLGPWAAEYYIQLVVDSDRQAAITQSTSFESSTKAEKLHLSAVLQRIQITPASSLIPHVTPQISDKVKKLINVLPLDGSSTGIVFVERRATVAVLAHLLSIIPETKDAIRVGTMVGTSMNSKKANITDIVDVKRQSKNSKNKKSTLDSFRTGELDILIATSVLEEGIDVPACNMVLCFDQPSNLKSFVQRRGRARHQNSKLVLMQSSASNVLGQWQKLEAEMKKLYEDNMRTLKEFAKLESAEDSIQWKFCVKETKALLNLDNAMSRLYHFCSKLPGGPYVNRYPDFIAKPGQPVRVILPISVDAAVREAQSRQSGWISEKHAKKEAAFEACVALYKAGLLDDHLMPLVSDNDRIIKHRQGLVKSLPSLVEVDGQINPWVKVAQNWISKVSLQTALLTVIDDSGDIMSSMILTLPIDIPSMPPMKLFWDSNTKLTVTFKPLGLKSPNTYDMLEGQQYTWVALNSVFGYRFSVRRDPQFITFFQLHTALDTIRALSQTGQPVPDRFVLHEREHTRILIRDDKSTPYLFEERLDRKPLESLVRHWYYEYEGVPDETPHLALLPLPKRRDFFHPVPRSNLQPLRKRYSYVLPESRCRVDDIPYSQVQAALLIPAIMHRLEVYMVADTLIKSLLSNVGYDDLSIVVTAISASVAREETDYQRLEFLGDSLLKTSTCIQLLAEYPQWHEGYLSGKKDGIIANLRLAKAARHCGLAKFILTKPFTGAKWRPIYVEDVLASKGVPNRELSSKVLADVVEALIGAAYIDGGMPKALTCMEVFLPQINWQPLENRRTAIFDRAPVEVMAQSLPYHGKNQETVFEKENAKGTMEAGQIPPTLQPLEELIGYTFKKKSLLVESMTHASCNMGLASLERLEFLGDAILEHIVVDTIYNQEIELPPSKMHLLRTALVNADFLAFLCMEWSIEQERCNVIEDTTSRSWDLVRTTTSLPLWKFMRHASQDLSNAQLDTAERHLSLRGDIKAAIASGSRHPWALLSKLRAGKFYSDMVESLLAAVYIDSGSFETCRGIVERIGILPYLRRLIDEDVHIFHPRQELGIMADNKKVRYEMDRTAADGTEQQEYTCRVCIGDEEITIIHDGVSRDEAQTRAAEAAILLLKRRATVEDITRLGEGKLEERIVDGGSLRGNTAPMDGSTETM